MAANRCRRSARRRCTVRRAKSTAIGNRPRIDLGRVVNSRRWGARRASLWSGSL
jgi:hypothetical protein